MVKRVSECDGAKYFSGLTRSFYILLEISCAKPIPALFLSPMFNLQPTKCINN